MTNGIECRQYNEHHYPANLPRHIKRYKPCSWASILASCNCYCRIFASGDKDNNSEALRYDLQLGSTMKPLRSGINAHALEGLHVTM